tara:strand:- start:651 stop:1022 length:372 start_codon:yes stop_codon:yes gene_type:complete
MNNYLVGGLVASASAVLLGIAYNNNNTESNFKMVKFSLLPESIYVIFCSNINTITKEMDVNKVYQIMGEGILIDIPIEQFTYETETAKFLFEPVYEKDIFVGYKIYSNTNENIDELISKLCIK